MTARGLKASLSRDVLTGGKVSMDACLTELLSPYTDVPYQYWCQLHMLNGPLNRSVTRASLGQTGRLVPDDIHAD